MSARHWVHACVVLAKCLIWRPVLGRHRPCALQASLMGMRFEGPPTHMAVGCGSGEWSQAAWPSWLHTCCRSKRAALMHGIRGATGNNALRATLRGGSNAGSRGNGFH